MPELIWRAIFLADGGQPGQHPGRRPAHANPRSTPRGRAIWPTPTSKSSRPKRRCAAPTAWPRWGSFPPDWRTSCAIRSAPSRPRPRCSAATSARRTKWRARWPGFISTRGGPHQFAGHPLSGIRAPAATAARRPADLAQMLDRAVALVEREAAAGVAIYKNYSPDIPPFPFDAELMERVFYNLLLNAAQASRRGRRRDREDARRRRPRGNRGDRPRLRHRPEASGQHLQSVLHHQAGGRRPGPGHRLQDRRRARR